MRLKKNQSSKRNNKLKTETENVNQLKWLWDIVNTTGQCGKKRQ